VPLFNSYSAFDDILISEDQADYGSEEHLATARMDSSGDDQAA
jgi:hypothetical protein